MLGRTGGNPKWFPCRTGVQKTTFIMYRCGSWANRCLYAEFCWNRLQNAIQPFPSLPRSGFAKKKREVLIEHLPELTT